ncbi:MAG: ABC transporter substrate-binding protein [Oscillospiraceae bacterium]
MNYLSEAYGCIIDMEVGIPDNGCVVGTGPYVATEVVTDDHVNLIKNVNYWDGEVKVDEITVRTISDGDTLAMALQSGEIDAAYGMAYASYPLFENDNYKFTSIQTSRCFWGMMNLNKENSGYTIMSDPAVRKAIAMGINKQDFVNVLLNGYGYTATGAFPDSFAFGQGIQTVSLIPSNKAERRLPHRSTPMDSIREERRQPRSADLPVPSGAASAGRIRSPRSDIGIDVQINCKGSQQHPQEPTAWDIWFSANAGLGDPRTSSTPTVWTNRSRTPAATTAKLEACRPAAHHLRSGRACEDRRRDAAAAAGRQLLRLLLLRMSMIMKANVSGLKHTHDF